VRVTVIDSAIRPEIRLALDELVDDFGALQLIAADGREKNALEAADIANAMAFVACTGEDSINLYAIMRARAMNPTMQIVVRVWDDSFNQQIDEFILHSRDNATHHGTITSIRSSANLAAPIFAGIALGVDLTQTLIVRDFENDREIKLAAVRLTVAANSFFENLTVGDIQQELYGDKQRADVVLHCPSDGLATMPPDTNSIVQAGDILVIFAEINICIAIAKRNHPGYRRRN
jgi:Trk K+ transport system NAD-binding subunit